MSHPLPSLPGEEKKGKNQAAGAAFKGMEPPDGSAALSEEAVTCRKTGGKRPNNKNKKTPCEACRLYCLTDAHLWDSDTDTL